MRIDGWRVDGFGCLKDHATGGLEPGVTVILGENEAGKSTLLAFLRAMLFGFPKKSTKERQYPPVRGGRHGGEVVLRDGQDAVWTLERYADVKGAASLRAADGRQGGEDELRRLLGGVDAPLYKSVFAFSLTELQDFATLDEEGVRDRIFSSGISGAGQSARDVIKRLDQRAAALSKQGKGDAEINNLVRDINEKQRDLVEAERRAGGYADLAAQEESCDVEARKLSEQVGPLRTRMGRLDALLELHPQWRELEGLRAELAELPEIIDDALPDRVAALTESLTQQRTREERLAGVQADLTTARADLNRHLALLGAGWDVERVRAFDDSIVVHDEVKAWADKLSGALAAAETADHELVALRSRVAELETQRERIAADLPKDEPRTVEAIVDAEARLSGLWSDVRDLEQQRLVDFTQRPAVPMGRKVGVLAAVLAATCAVAAAVGLIAGYAQLAVGLLVAAIMLAATAVVALVGGGRGGSSRSGANADSRSTRARSQGSPVDELQRRVEATAEGLGLPAAPSSADLEAMRASLGEERTRRSKWDAVGERLRDADLDLVGEGKKVDAAIAQASRLRSGAEAATTEWRKWLAERGLADMSPGGVVEHLGVLAEARTADGALASAERDLDEIERCAVEWDEAALQALIAAGRTASGLDRQTTRAALGTLHQALLRRRDVVVEIGRLDRAIANRFGGAESAAEAVLELATGDDLAWNEERGHLEEEVEELDGQRVTAIESRTLARQQREDIEESADIARLQMERESLKAELAAKVHDYRVIVTARGLIAATLQTYVRERQPAVLKRASKSFAQVTGGRYTSVEQDEEGKESVVVVAHNGCLAPEQLSRGTAEQLYLAIRLALVDEVATRSAPLPLIMDDCLVNFDPQRAEQMAKLLASSSREGQCLLFTCHPETAELMVAQSEGAARVIRLQLAAG
jgi:uncharacterized protein YhaN